MFPELNNILNFDEKTPPKGKSVLVSQSNSDGTFLLHHFISLYLKGNNNVCVLGLAQSYSHYSNVGNKLGPSLTTAREKNKLVFIEGLKILGEYLLKCDDHQEQSSIRDSPFECLRTENYSLKKLYELTEKSIHTLPSWQGTPTLLLIDDIGILLRLGIPAKDILAFVHYLQVLLCPNSDSAGCVAMLLQNDRGADDEEADMLTKAIWHQSDMVLHVQGLASGYCKDVHGQVLYIVLYRSYI